jgi:hypothetical protein
MQHSKLFANFFANYNYDLPTVEKKIDTLIEIALTTNNGSFDDPEDRADLFFFKMGLMEVLESAHILAEKQHQRFLQNELVTRGRNAI